MKKTIYRRQLIVVEKRVGQNRTQTKELTSLTSKRKSAPFCCSTGLLLQFFRIKGNNFILSVESFLEDIVKSQESESPWPPKIL